MNSPSKWKTQNEVICKMFVDDFTKLYSKYRDAPNNYKTNKYPELINYYLNHELSIYNINNT